MLLFFFFCPVFLELSYRDGSIRVLVPVDQRDSGQLRACCHFFPWEVLEPPTTFCGPDMRGFLCPVPQMSVSRTGCLSEDVPCGRVSGGLTGDHHLGLKPQASPLPQPLGSDV